MRRDNKQDTVDRDGHSLHTPGGQAACLCSACSLWPTSANSIVGHRKKIHKLQGPPHLNNIHRRTIDDQHDHMARSPYATTTTSTKHLSYQPRWQELLLSLHSRPKGRVPSMRLVGKEQSPRTILFVSVRFKLFFYCQTPNTAIYSFFFQTIFKAGICKQDICAGCRDENIVRNSLSQHYDT